jgi:hypothetical protein
VLGLIVPTGFDSLTSHSLSLWPSRPCRGFPSRSILDFARNDSTDHFCFCPSRSIGTKRTGSVALSFNWPFFFSSK